MVLDADVVALVAIAVSVLIGIVVLVWQGLVQGSKYDSLNQRMDAMYQLFDSKFDAQSKLIADTAQRLENRMDAQIQRSEDNTRALMQQTERNHREDIRRLDAMAQVLGQRLSDSEREQARLEGVNSVLQQQTHQHEPSPSD